MTNASPIDTPVPPRAGGISRALTGLFMKQALVTGSETLAEGFHLITLQSPEFKGIQWAPGQKLQISMQSAFVTRTFTPMEWNATAGVTCILGYAHGDGPGSVWVRNVKAGDACDVFGPRRSIDFSDAAVTNVLLGDETSIGLASALARAQPGRWRCLLEVSALTASLAVLSHLQLDCVDLFVRLDSAAHLTQIESRLPVFAASDAVFVLTGAAPSIQGQRIILKSLGVPASRLKVKAYWAPGKTGLD